MPEQTHKQRYDPGLVLVGSGQPIVETGDANVPGSFWDSKNIYRNLSGLISAIRYYMLDGELSGCSYE